MNAAEMEQKNSHKENISWQLVQRGLLELLLYFPLFLVAARYGIKAQHNWLWLAGLPIGMLAGYALNRMLKFHHPFTVGLVSLPIGAISGFLFFGATISGAVAAAPAVFGLYRGARIFHLGFAGKQPVRPYLLGILYYFMTSAICLRLEPFAADAPILLIGGFTSLVLTFFAINSQMVGDESFSGSREKPRVEAAVRRYNGWLVSAMIILTLIIGFSYQIQLLLRTLWAYLSEWLQALLQGGGTGEEPLVQPMPENSQPPMLPEPGKTSPFWEYLSYLFIGLLIIAAIWIVFRLLKYVPGWIRALQERLAWLFGRERAAQAAQGYVDEVENIHKERRIGDWFRKRGHSGGRWKDMQDNTARVRYLYRFWLDKQIKSGIDFRAYLTPSELQSEASKLGRPQADAAESEQLERKLIARYDAVRYGNKAVADEELAALQQLLQRKRK
ncbi:DUF4129 domain-containing protein [Paenibacillus sp. GCM10027626]|uniref:DUF4129 domain-containing protein n=1 Tax=Paenibacillus sp. GCM10027626 TaxID=3273411 RepID=UPI0036337FD0